MDPFYFPTKLSIAAIIYYIDKRESKREFFFLRHRPGLVCDNGASLSRAPHVTLAAAPPTSYLAAGVCPVPPPLQRSPSRHLSLTLEPSPAAHPSSPLGCNRADEPVPSLSTSLLNPASPPNQVLQSQASEGGDGGGSVATPEVAERVVYLAEAMARRDAWRKENVPDEAGNSSKMEMKGCTRSIDSGHHDRFNHQDFPSLQMTGHLKQRKKKYGPPFDTDDWYFKYSARRKDFPFNQIGDEALKIKFVPIRLEWASNRGNRAEEEVEGNSEIRTFRGGRIREPRWFRPPPKVRLVQGILGPHLSQVTRVVHQDNGEQKVSVRVEAGHRPLSPSSRVPDEVDSQNPPIPNPLLVHPSPKP